MSDPRNPITYFGQTDARSKKVPFGIKASDRSRHMYVIGKTGMGKSTLLENMAIQDIQNGNGMTFIDPHGKTAEMLLDYVPESRINDVLYFAPFDLDFPVSFNVMEDVGIDKRHLVVSGLMSTFEKIWVDAWSARMAYILSNTLLALLEYPGATLLGINRVLADKEYRKLVIANVKDPAVRAFWVDEFAKYSERYAQEATPAIQNKVGQFTSNPLIRNIIGQPQSTLDLRKMMDSKKITIINLSKGRVGEGNANLLGSMLITKLYLAAMSRADLSESSVNKLPSHYLFVDEFQSFANKSFADILSEARKYKLCLTLAHQYVEQMEEEVRAAVFGNVGTTVAFRVGAFDAELLEKEFAPLFVAEDLVNLGVFQIYLKLMIDGVGSQPFSATTLPPIKQPDISFKQEIIAASRRQFARPRSIVEEEIRVWHSPVVVAPRRIEGTSVESDAGHVLRGGKPPVSQSPSSDDRHTPTSSRERAPEHNNPRHDHFGGTRDPRDTHHGDNARHTTSSSHATNQPTRLPLSALEQKGVKDIDAVPQKNGLREALAALLSKENKDKNSDSQNPIPHKIDNPNHQNNPNTHHHTNNHNSTTPPAYQSSDNRVPIKNPSINSGAHVSNNRPATPTPPEASKTTPTPSVPKEIPEDTLRKILEVKD